MAEPHEEWLQKKERSAFHEGGQSGVTVEPERLLTVGPVNRTIIDENQSYALILAYLGANRFSRCNRIYRELRQYHQLTETHQQSMAGPTNAREQFIRLGSSFIQAVGAALKKEVNNLIEN